MLRAAALVERLGIPTASIIGSGFFQQADLVARGLGLPLALAEYPGTPMVDSEAELRRKVDETLAPGIIRGLMQGAEKRAAESAEPAPGSVVYSGTLDEIEDYFYRQLWTDGLPIIPPTRRRVEAFLRFTDRSKR